jgi:hypothetical protein
MLRSVLALSILLAFLAGCSERNPIHGTWVVDSDASSTGAQAAAAVAGLTRLEFRESQLVIGSESTDVSYETDGERVIVTRTTEGSGDVYTITEEGLMEMGLPMGITVVYRRLSDTPPVAAAPEDPAVPNSKP